MGEDSGRGVTSSTQKDGWIGLIVGVIVALAVLGISYVFYRANVPTTTPPPSPPAVSSAISSVPAG